MQHCFSIFVVFFCCCFLDPYISQEPGQYANGRTIKTVGFLSPQVNDQILDLLRHQVDGRFMRSFFQFILEHL